jgi:hypothetical protein
MGTSTQAVTTSITTTAAQVTSPHIGNFTQLHHDFGIPVGHVAQLLTMSKTIEHNWQ